MNAMRFDVCLAQGAPTTFMEWLIISGGPMTLVLPIVTTLMIAGAVWVVLYRRSPALIASCFTVLPLPFLVCLILMAIDCLKSFSVVAVTNTALRQDELAQALSASVIAPIMSLMMTLPSYAILSVGLIWRCAQAADGPQGGGMDCR